MVVFSWWFEVYRGLYYTWLIIKLECYHWLNYSGTSRSSLHALKRKTKIVRENARFDCWIWWEITGRFLAAGAGAATAFFHENAPWPCASPLLSCWAPTSSFLGQSEPGSRGGRLSPQSFTDQLILSQSGNRYYLSPPWMLDLPTTLFQVPFSILGNLWSRYWAHWLVVPVTFNQWGDDL